MRRYQTLHNVTLSGVSAPAPVPISNEGKAMGMVPGWKMFLDPAYLINNEFRNRVQRTGTVKITGGTFTPAEFPNGAPALGAFAEYMNPRMQANLSINNAAWTAFCVIRIGPGDAPPEFIRAIIDTEEPYIIPRMGFNDTRGSMTFFEGVRNSRARYDAGTNWFLERTVHAMWTFSVRDGIRMFINGKKVAENADDKRPFDHRYQSGQWEMFRGFRGLIGMCGLLDVDLGQDEYTGYRRVIDQFMIEKYGITE